jgi:hypothetical protein
MLLQLPLLHRAGSAHTRPLLLADGLLAVMKCMMGLLQATAGEPAV